MGNLKVWKDSHSMLRNPQSNTWSVECGVLSIRHKFGARSRHDSNLPASLMLVSSGPTVTVVKWMSVPSGTYNPTWRSPRTIKFYKRLIPLLKIVPCL